MRGVALISRDRRKRKAVSAMIATLMLIGITAAIGSFIYWYAMTYAKSTSRVASVEITKAKITYVSDNTVSVLVSVRNQGTTALELRNITVRSPSGELIDLLKEENVTITPRTSVLGPGDSVTVVYFGRLNVNVGDVCLITVVTDQDAQEIAVQCMRAA